jgi:hypothetical protein
MVGGAVGFVHDDEFWTVLEEIGPMMIALGVVDADDDVWVIAENAVIARGKVTLESADGARPNDHCLKAEMTPKLSLPLVAEVRRAEDADAVDFPTVEQFARNQQGLDGLSDTHVIGNQHSHRIEPERHEERDELVGPRAYTNPSKRTKGTSAVTESEPGGVEKQFDPHRVADVLD